MRMYWSLSTERSSRFLQGQSPASTRSPQHVQSTSPPTKPLPPQRQMRRRLQYLRLQQICMKRMWEALAHILDYELSVSSAWSSRAEEDGHLIAREREKQRRFCLEETFRLISRRECWAEARLSSDHTAGALRRKHEPNGVRLPSDWLPASQGYQGRKALQASWFPLTLCVKSLSVTWPGRQEVFWPQTAVKVLKLHLVRVKVDWCVLWTPSFILGLETSLNFSAAGCAFVGTNGRWVVGSRTVTEPD